MRLSACSVTVATASSGRRAGKARSSTRRSRRPTSCPRGGRRFRRRPRIASSGAMMRRGSGTPSGRSRGSGGCCPRACASGRLAATMSGHTEFVEEAPPDRPFALLGVRSCDLHAIAIQDRVFLEGAYVDRDYSARREDAFLVAVNCGVPGGTCFCTSMGTGPRAESGFDLALTELVGERAPVRRRGGLRAGGRGPRGSHGEPGDRCGRGRRARCHARCDRR